MPPVYSQNSFNGLEPYGPPNPDLTNFAIANGSNAHVPPSFFEGNRTAGQYNNYDSSQLPSAVYGNSDFPLSSGLLGQQEEFTLSPVFPGLSDASQSRPLVSSSPGVLASTEPSSPTSPVQQLSERSQRFLNSLPESTRKSVGWNHQLDRMFTENPDFIPTFNFEAAMSMTGRDVVNPVSGVMPPAVVGDSADLGALCNQLGIDPTTMTCEELAAMGEDFLDSIASQPIISEIFAQYRYEPTVEPETISTILPNVGKTLEENPLMLNWYQEPLRKGDALPDAEPGEEVDPVDDEEEEEETTDAKGKGNKKSKGDSKYLPRKVQYAPYRYLFKTAEEARTHRKKVRHPAKIARDIDRVEKYGRYYWTKRIYEAMINVDLIFDNKASTIATNFSKIHHFDEEDLEATAHHIFDACIGVHRRGWHGYDYNRRDFKRGKLKDIFPETIEGRLERICGILKHSKAIANDCVQGGDLLMQTVDNPIHRASTKTANNKGNLDRAYRLKKQETERQKEKRLAKEAAQREKAEGKARKEAEKRAEKARKDAEKQAVKERKQAEKEAAAAARTSARTNRA